MWELLLAPMWHPLAVYHSTVLKIHELCIDGDDACIGPGWIVAATKWNLLHPIQGD